MLRLFRPHFLLESVCELSPGRIREMGLEALLLDVDCTLKRYGDEQPTAEVMGWLEEVREAGIGLCLVSNGLGRRIRPMAERLGLPLICRALKPLPVGCRAAMRQMGFRPGTTAMVGDQVFADVMAARWAGLTSILVRPIHPEEEPWFTRLKRHPERWVLGRIGQDPS